LSPITRSTPPLAGNFGGFDQASLHIQDRHVPGPQAPSVDRYVVSADYFATTHIPLRRGATSRRPDAESRRKSRSSAKKQRARFSPTKIRWVNASTWRRNDDRPWAEIVGIVGDIHQYGLDAPTTPQAYVLYTPIAGQLRHSLVGS